MELDDGMVTPSAFAASMPPLSVQLTSLVQAGLGNPHLPGPGCMPAKQPSGVYPACIVSHLHATNWVWHCRSLFVLRIRLTL